MSYRLQQYEPLEEGVRRIAEEQIDKALAEIDDSKLGRHDTVHQVRKRCKKLRALARLVRPALPAYQRINTLYRDAARDLSSIRDAHAVIETFDDLLDHFDGAIDPDAFEPIRNHLVARRDEANAEVEAIDRRIARLRDTMSSSRKNIESWSLEDEGSAVLGVGVKKTYRRANKARAKATDTRTTAAFHEWRKRIKYHWYHARLLQSCWPKLIEPWASETHRLSNLLGDEHDLAVLHAMLFKDPDRFADRKTLQAFFGLIERRRAQLRVNAFGLGKLLQFEKPKHLGNRVCTYFDALQANNNALEAPAPRDVGE
ncbi:MAG: CHAD domain-containing protein [Wenzhouxiangella sp.]|jgi:CHAD domain-containing protein|nr:CHAD domain-containing protein [Wenzhouxiangella sp.]